MRSPLDRLATALVVAGMATLLPASRRPNPAGPLSYAARQTPAAISPELVRRLSIEEAVKLALEQNLGIRIERFDPQIQDVNVALARLFGSPSLGDERSAENGSEASGPRVRLSGGATSVGQRHLLERPLRRSPRCCRQERDATRPTGTISGWTTTNRSSEFQLRSCLLEPLCSQ